MQLNMERPHTIKVRVSYVHEIDALTGETWCDLLALLFHVQDERKETFDVRRGNVVTIRPLDQGFALEIEYGNHARHYARRARVKRETIKKATEQAKL